MSTALDVIRKKAREAHAGQELLIAERHYRTLLEKQPNIDDVINLGALLRSQGRLQESSRFYKTWITCFDKDPRLILNACNCWNDNDESQIAIQLLETYFQEKSADKQLLICYSDTLNRLNRLQECSNVLRKCIKDDPYNKEAWIRLGLNYAKGRNLNDALQAFEKANEIDPQDNGVISNRITLLKDIGRFDDANQLIKGLSNEQQLKVDIAQATAGLMLAQNKLVEATKLYQHICTKEPVNSYYWLNWAAALRALRWTVAPYRILQRALCYEPLSEDIQEALLQILSEMAKNDAAERCMNLWPKSQENMKNIYLFNRHFLGIGTSETDSATLALQARSWEAACKSKTEGNLWQDTIQMPPDGRKLRIGYLSADFANHPVGRFLLPILSNHNAKTVEVWALSCGSHDDWITDHIRKNVDHWVDLRFRSIPECARITADLHLDVIVELGGFSSESHIEFLCHRPAPIQLSYLGYPGPTYLKCIDGWIGDRVLFEQLNSIDKNAHSLIEIDGGYMVFDAGGDIPIPKRAKGKKFRFGSFNHARKLTQSTIDLFCKIIAANPDSMLVIKSISFCEEAEKQRIQERFEKTGLSSEKLLLLDWVEGGINHLNLYSEIDVALDPIPYGGATTTAEALWMGVPVVAMAGKGMVGRLAASILIHGNQQQWVARSEEQYIQIASNLAQQGPRSEKVRYSLRRDLEQSALTNGKRLSQALEREYLKLRRKITLK